MTRSVAQSVCDSGASCFNSSKLRARWIISIALVALAVFLSVGLSVCLTVSVCLSVCLMFQLTEATFKRPYQQNIHIITSVNEADVTCSFSLSFCRQNN